VAGIVDGQLMRNVAVSLAASRDARGLMARRLGAALIEKRATEAMHAKVLVVDDVVVTGSYNFSKSASANAENVVIVRCAKLARRYARYVERLIAKYREAAPPSRRAA
jgi:phosphatidylserine/phosphatidylglycerophosphate/cardiolipin synthase-like enzyme